MDVAFHIELETWHLIVASVAAYFLVGLILARIAYRLRDDGLKSENAVMMFFFWPFVLALMTLCALGRGLLWLIKAGNG
jgi:hypothetical protein